MRERERERETGVSHFTSSVVATQPSVVDIRAFECEGEISCKLKLAALITE